MSLEESHTMENGNRSKKKAYIVLVGMTGAGKSSTINVFLGRGSEEAMGVNLCLESNTKEIIEYSITVPTIDDKAKHELIIIDTPGFGDTSGIEKDARILATLEKYLAEHKELGSCYPTAVFLTIKIVDPQMLEENSNFIGLLKALKAFIANRTLIDIGHNKCNVVVVLTHYMSLGNQLQHNPQPKKDLVTWLLQTFANIPANFQIAMAENFPMTYNLPKHEGYFELPNKECYPFNLFKAVEKLSNKSGDIMGENIIRDAFATPYKLEISSQKKIKLLPPEDQSTMVYRHKILSDKLNLFDTPLGSDLQAHWDSLPKNETNQFAACINIVKANFILLGIAEKNDIPKKVEDTIRLLQVLPMNSAVEKVVTKLGIRPPSLTGLIGVGYIYNLLTDNITSINSVDTKHEYITDVGFRAPKCFRVNKVVTETELVFINGTIFKSNHEYFEHRLTKLNIPYKGDLHEKFTGSPVAGYNVCTNKNVSKLTALLEIRVYSVSLGDNVKLNQTYLSSLDIEDTRKRQQKHLGRVVISQGSHIVESAMLGGYVVLNATLFPKMKLTSKITDVMLKMKEALEGLDKGKMTMINIPQWGLEIDFFGGDPTLTKPRFSEIGQQSFLDFYDKWKKSLEVYPTCLLTNISLCHVSQHLQFENFDLAEAMSEAVYKKLRIEKFNERVTRRDNLKRSWCRMT